MTLTLPFTNTQRNTQTISELSTHKHRGSHTHIYEDRQTETDKDISVLSTYRQKCIHCPLGENIQDGATMPSLNEF